MKIKIAETYGFCFGVKRALDIAFDATEKSKKIYSYGQLIHNDQVSEKLSSQGLVEVKEIGNLNNCDMIIRSHGVGRNIYEISEHKNINVIDCTCPYVKKVHTIVKKYHDKNFKIIIIGDPNHPEVIGINGWCDNKAIIIKDEKSIPELSNHFSYCVVAQTTLKEATWIYVTNIIKGCISNVEFFNTICSATSERQLSTIKLAKEVDCMIVIGGFHSSNSIKLYEIAKEYCKNIYHIEKKSDLVMTKLEKCDTIGITAGASTPNWIIDEVCDYIDLYEKS